MIVVLSENYRRAHYTLTHRDPPVNPRGRGVLIITNVYDGMRKIRGYRFTEPEDELIWESGPEGPYDACVELIRELNRRGFAPK